MRYYSSAKCLAVECRVVLGVCEHECGNQSNRCQDKRCQVCQGATTITTDRQPPSWLSPISDLSPGKRDVAQAGQPNLPCDGVHGRDWDGCGCLGPNRLLRGTSWLLLRALLLHLLPCQLRLCQGTGLISLLLLSLLLLLWWTARAAGQHNGDVSSRVSTNAAHSSTKARTGHPPTGTSCAPGVCARNHQNEPACPARDPSRFLSGSERVAETGGTLGRPFENTVSGGTPETRADAANKIPRGRYLRPNAAETGQREPE